MNMLPRFFLSTCLRRCRLGLGALLVLTGVGWGQVETLTTFTGTAGAQPGDAPYDALGDDGAGTLWGTTSAGGAADFGTLFKVDKATGAVTTVLEFTGNGVSNKGAYPYGGPVSDGAGLMWGTTQSGGANNQGTVYRVSVSSGVLTTVVEFNSVLGLGQNPSAALVNDGAGFMWGTAMNGGSGANGTVFKVEISTGTLTKVADFTGSSGPARGSSSRGVLVSDGAGFFWGTTVSGGTSNFGTVFKVNASTGVLTAVVDFTGTSGANKGRFPFCGLSRDESGMLWGVTSLGGSVPGAPGGLGYGTLFKVDPATGILTTVVEFTGNGATNKGSLPEGALVDDGAGSWLGTTAAGGSPGAGTIFKVQRDTGKLTTLVNFTAFGPVNAGNAPSGGLVGDGAGSFWGTTTGSGGLFGTVYKLGTVSFPVVPPPVYVTEATVTGEVGTTFVEFGAPAIDGGLVGGRAFVKESGGRALAAIYGADGSVLARSGRADPEGAQFLEIGDPVFGGEAYGFAGTARQTAATSPLLRMDRSLSFGGDRSFSVRPGGKLAALYSQLTKAVGLKRLATQAGAAPGTGGGQFAKFGGFGLPRTRGGLVFTGNLHRGDTVTKANDFGVWREKTDGGDSDLLLRQGTPVTLAGGGTRDLKKVTLLTPEANLTDQRRSFGADGSVVAKATFADGKSGVVTVAADGSVAVPLDSASAVPDEAGAPLTGVEFEAFKSSPATAGGGRIALLAALRAAQRGLPPPPREAILSNQGGTMRRLLARGDDVPGRTGVRFAALGSPAMGQTGVIGLIAALTGQGVRPATRQAIVRIDAGVKTVVARLGDAAPGFGAGGVYRRFMSVVVTDSDPARVVFTATVSGKGVKGSNNVGLWSSSAASGTRLLMRKGGPIKVGDETVTVRSFEALQAPKKSVGQGRGTDASGFVTAKAKLSDGRSGVLRIPLP